MMTYRVSVVVPTYRRPELLQRCLYALLTQDFDPEAYEIIIVDDARCAETEQQVAHWSVQARIRGHTLCYLTPACSVSHGPAAARNVGWRAARGQIIAFTDDDCIPTPHWLKAGVAAFTAEVMAVSGRVIVPLSGVPTDYERNAAYLETSEFVTASCFYRREALLQVGGFDERFTAAWREDSDLYFTFLQRDMLCRSSQEAQVLHPVRPARWGVSVQQQRKSQFNALLYKKHPKLYKERLQPSPPWHYYWIVGGLLLGLLGVTRRSPLLTISGLALWSWLSGEFCLKRLQETSHAPGHVWEMLITSLIIPPLSIFWRLVGAFKFRVFFL